MLILHVVRHIQRVCDFQRTLLYYTTEVACAVEAVSRLGKCPAANVVDKDRRDIGLT